MSEEANELQQIEESVQQKLAEQGLVEKPSVEKPEIDLEGIPEDDRKYVRGFDPSGEKSLQQYINDGKFMETISRVNRENKELKATLNELKGHIDKQREAGYRKALEDLKAERDAAIALGDIDEVNKVEEAIASHQKDLAPQTPPAVQNFLSRYDNIMKDPSYEAQQVREFIHKRDNELMKFNLDPEQHVEVIEKDMRKVFPQLFAADKPVSSPNAVESDASPVVQNRKKRFSFSDLNEDQKACCRHFKKQGIMSEEEYINQLVNLGELKHDK